MSPFACRAPLFSPPPSSAIPSCGRFVDDHSSFCPSRIDSFFARTRPLTSLIGWPPHARFFFNSDLVVPASFPASSERRFPPAACCAPSLLACPAYHHFLFSFSLDPVFFLLSRFQRGFSCSAIAFSCPTSLLLFNSPDGKFPSWRSPSRDMPLP